MLSVSVAFCTPEGHTQPAVDIRVAAYGAVGDGKVDDGAAIRADMAAATRVSTDDPKVRAGVSFDRDRVYYVGPWDER